MAVPMSVAVGDKKCSQREFSTFASCARDICQKDRDNVYVNLNTSYVYFV